MCTPHLLHSERSKSSSRERLTPRRTVIQSVRSGRPLSRRRNRQQTPVWLQCVRRRPHILGGDDAKVRRSRAGSTRPAFSASLTGASVDRMRQTGAFSGCCGQSVPEGRHCVAQRRWGLDDERPVQHGQRACDPFEPLGGQEHPHQCLRHACACMGDVGADAERHLVAPWRPADGDLRLPRNSPPAIFGSRRSMAVINALSERGGRTDEGAGKSAMVLATRFVGRFDGGQKPEADPRGCSGACAATAAVWAVSAAPMPIPIPIPASMNLVPRTMTPGGRLRRLCRRCGWRQLGLCSRRPRWGNQTSSARMLACGVK